MLPFSEVYGCVAPFRSMSGLVATSFSYSANLYAGMSIFFFVLVFVS